MIEHIGKDRGSLEESGMSRAPDSKMQRRHFLSALGAGAALACKAAEAAGPTPAAAPPKDEWAAFRTEFELAPDWVHLAGFLLASHPRRVRDAIERHRRALDENPALYVEAHAFDQKPVLEPAAAYLGARPEEIALTDSTTMGLALLYSGLPLASGDDVLTTTHDHYSTHESLRLASARSGATLRKVPLYDTPAKASADGMAKALASAIIPKTRVVAITWVHSSTGVKTPVRAIADEVARVNRSRKADQQIWLCVDGVHGFGIEDVTMASLGADFFVAGAHKWLFGPRGTGVVWGKAEHWSKLRPIIPHFGAAAYGAWMTGAPPPPTTADMMTPGGFHSFEHRWALGEAFALHQALGKAKVAARIHELNTQCKEGLAKLKHVTLHTPLSNELSSGIITFEVAGLKPEEVVKRLHEKRIVASTTPYATSYARLAPGLINSGEDVERAVGEIRALR
jgi:isopenicillin-N epimerase